MSKIFSFIFLFLISSFAAAWNTPTIAAHFGNTNMKWLWTGAGADSLWSNGANWCGTLKNGVCQGATSGPTTTASIIFDGTCIANSNNCSPTGIPGGAQTIGALQMKSTFTGTVNFGATNLTVNGDILIDGGTFTKTTGTLTIVNHNFKMTGGTFNGGSGTFTVGGSSGNVFTASGGGFTAPTGSISATTDTFNLTGLNSFTHNSGTIALTTTGNGTTIFPNSFTFNNLTVKACNRTFTLQGPITLDGNYTTGVTGSSACTTTVNNSYIELKSGSYFRTTGLIAGSTNIKFTGSGQQKIDTSGTNNGVVIPGVIVAQAVSGSVKFSTAATLVGWDDSATLGTIVTNGQAIGITSGTYNSTALTWPVITIFGSSGSYAAFTSLLVTNLVLSGTGTSIAAPAGEITVAGDVTSAAGGGGFSGFAVIDFAGAGNQGVDLSTATTQYLPTVKIAKSGGTLTFNGTPDISGNFNYVAGTYVAPATMRFGNGTAGTAQITNNGFTFNSVEFIGLNNYLFTDDMNVSGSLTLNQTTGTATLGAAQPTRNINVQGDVIVASGRSGMIGDAMVKLVGPGTQKIDMTAATGSKGNLPSLGIATSGTVNLAGTIVVNSNYTFTGGSLSAGTSTLWFQSNSTPFTQTFAGTESYNNITYNTFQAGANLSGTLNVNGTLSAYTGGGFTLQTLGGTINAKGDIVATGYGWYGTTVLNIVGSSDQKYDYSGASAPSGRPTALPTVIASTGGTVTLLGRIQTDGNWTVNSGTVDAGTSWVYLAGNGSHTFKPGAVNYYDLSMTANSNQTWTITGSISTLHNMTLGPGTNNTFNMPNPGTAYSVTVGNLLTVGAGATLKLYGGSLSAASQSVSGTIVP